jgi:hypothetical protein
MDFFQSQTAQAVAILPSSISRTFNCTSKTAGSPRAEMIPPAANKVLLKVAFLYTLMDFFRRKLCPSRCYLTFFHIPERSIALVKRLAGSPKG